MAHLKVIWVVVWSLSLLCYISVFEWRILYKTDLCIPASSIFTQNSWLGQIETWVIFQLILLTYHIVSGSSTLPPITPQPQPSEELLTYFWAGLCWLSHAFSCILMLDTLCLFIGCQFASWFSASVFATMLLSGAIRASCQCWQHLYIMAYLSHSWIFKNKYKVSQLFERKWSIKLEVYFRESA